MKEPAIDEEVNLPKKKVSNFIRGIKNPTFKALENYLKSKKFLTMDEAKAHVSKLHVRKFNPETDTVEEYSLKSSIDELQRFGEGLYFYFYFVKFFAFIFLIIAIFSFIGMILNSTGDGLGYASQVNKLIETTLGNTSAIVFTASEMANLSQISLYEQNIFISDRLRPAKTHYYIIMISDMIICCTFLIGYFMFKSKIRFQARLIEICNISVRKYTIMIRGFGENPDKKEIKQFFQQFGDLISVSFGYRLNDTLYLLKGLAGDIEKYRNSIEKPMIKEEKSKLTKRIETRLKKICWNLKTNKVNLVDNTNFDIHCAFIIFNSAETSLNIIKQFKEAYKITLKNKLFCRSKLIPTKYLYQEEKKLKISIPDHPSNIVWNNLGYSKFKKNLKVACMLLIGILLIFVSFLINLYLIALAEYKEIYDCSGITVKYENLSSDSADYNFNLSCYCSSFSIKEILTVSINRSLCYSELLEQTKQLAITVGVGISISVINITIQIIIFKLTEWIRYDNRTEIITKKILFTLMIQYFNTCFVVYLMYGKIFDFNILEFFNTTTGTQYFKIKNYIFDIGRNWYVNIGSKIISPVIIGIINPNLVHLALGVYLKLRNRRKSKKITNPDEYIKINTPRHFIMEAKYSSVIKSIFVAFTFSTGMPILNLLAFVFLLVDYWVNKYIVLRNARKPPIYSKKIIKNVIMLLPFALIIHCLFGMYIITNLSIFPLTYEDYLETLVAPEPYTNISNYIAAVYKRCNRCLPYTLMTVVIIVVCLFEKVLIRVFQVFKSKKIETQTNLNMNNYVTNYEKIKYFSLPNYNFTETPDYEQLLIFKTFENIIPILTQENPFTAKYLDLPKNEQLKGRKSMFQKIEEKVLKNTGDSNKKATRPIFEV